MSFFNIFSPQFGNGVFIREVQFFAFPLTESEGGGDVSQAKIFNSSGKNTDLRISFRVNKFIMSLGTPDTTEVTLYNISENSKNLLAKKATNVSLEIGYKEGAGQLQLVSTGGIASVTSERQGPDIKTIVFAYDGQDGFVQAVSKKAFKGNTTLKSLVVALANDIPGVKVSPENIKIPNDVVVGSKGRVVAGRTTHFLSRLAEEFGFNWTVQQKVFKAVPDNNLTGNTYIVNSESGNLIRVTPQIDNIAQVATTLNIEMVMDTRINPGDFIDLKSNINPTLNGRFQVTSISHVGDTHSDVWQSNIQCIIKQGDRKFIPTSANSPANDQQGN